VKRSAKFAQENLMIFPEYAGGPVGDPRDAFWHMEDIFALFNFYI
jgi:hypothetical protein